MIVRADLQLAEGNEGKNTAAVSLDQQWLQGDGCFCVLQCSPEIGNPPPLEVGC